MDLSKLTPKELDSPTIPLPPGIARDTTNPYEALFYVTTISCSVVTTTAVAGRIFTRLRISRNIGRDDYTCVLAWLAFVAYVGLCFWSADAGCGFHQWDLTLRQTLHIYKLGNYVQLLYGPVIYLTKLSILFQYLRVFVPTRVGNRLLFYTIHFAIWANLVFFILDTLIGILVCLPQEHGNPLTKGKCSLSIIVATAAVNVVSDVSILLLPVGSIWRLKVSTREKAKISTVFAVGVFACATSVARLVYTVGFVHTPDTTYSLAPLGLWSIAEIGVGIICGCLPVFPRLIRHFKPKVVSLLSYRRTVVSKENTSVATLQGPYKNVSSPWDNTHGSPPKSISKPYLLDDPTSVTAVVVEPPPRLHLWKAEPLPLGGEVDLEEGVPKGGIRKVVRMETGSYIAPVEAEEGARDLWD